MNDCAWVVYHRRPITCHCIVLLVTRSFVHIYRYLVSMLQHSTIYIYMAAVFHEPYMSDSRLNCPVVVFVMFMAYRILGQCHTAYVPPVCI